MKSNLTKIINPNKIHHVATKPKKCKRLNVLADLRTDGANECYYDDDYWAGAVAKCGGTDNLLTVEQLGVLATYLYNFGSTIGAEQNIDSGLTLYTQKAAQFLSVSAGSTYGWFHVWSGQETSERYVASRNFASSYTYFYNYNGNYRNSDNVLAVCVE